jgi:5'-nucleotidase
MPKTLKSNLLTCLFIISTLFVGCDKTNTNTQDTDFELNIAHINDTHSHITSENYILEFNNTKTYVNIGGYPRVFSEIKALQKSKKNLLILNAGDTFQGTIYYSIFKGQADAQMLNLIPWDALELGNHEFDDGDEHLANYLDKLNLKSSDILASNIEVSPENPLYKKFSPYTIKTFKNLQKVAIIGIDILSKTKYSSNPDADDKFKDEVETAQKYIDEVKSKGINKIILLSHTGLKNDKIYASKLDGVDIIIGGDSHSLMGDFSKVGLISDEISYPFITNDKNSKKVCIVQAWQYNYAIGELKAIFDADGNIIECFGDTKLLLGETFLQKDTNGKKVLIDDDKKSKILKMISNTTNIKIVQEDKTALATQKIYTNQIQTKAAQVIGNSSQYLGHNRIPNDGFDGVSKLPLGSDIVPIVAKSFYDISNIADASIQNAGGIKIPIKEGNITIGDAYTLLPFSNTLYEIKMTGLQIKQVLMDAVDESIFGGKDNKVSTGAFPYAYALRYDVDTTSNKDETIKNLEIMDRETQEFSPIDETKTYIIITNSYIASGKDGYNTFKSILDNDPSKGVDTYLDYAMSFVKYVQKTKSISKLPSDKHPIKSFR